MVRSLLLEYGLSLHLMTQLTTKCSVQFPGASKTSYLHLNVTKFKCLFEGIVPLKRLRLLSSGDSVCLFLSIFYPFLFRKKKKKKHLGTNISLHLGILCLLPILKALPSQSFQMSTPGFTHPVSGL